jgi:hypothetical protein
MTKKKTVTKPKAKKPAAKKKARMDINQRAASILARVTKS